jgi:type VI protein secretion system component Hcp
MRKGLLLTLTVIALAAAATLFGLIGPEGAVGAGKSNPVVGTLAIEGLTPAGEPIDVLAYSWGASNSATIGGPGGGAGAGKVNLQDLSFTKAFDELSPEIVQALATGEHFDGATLLVDADGRPSKRPTHRYEFNTLILTSVSQGGSGGQQQLTENVTFTFGALQLTNE